MTTGSLSTAAGLIDRVAIVTGAGSARGRAVARAFAAAGADVACIDSSHGAALASAQSIEIDGGSAWALRAEVTVQKGAEAAIAEVQARCGRIDVLCNVLDQPGDESLVEDIAAGDFDRVFRTNFKGVLFASQAAGRRMIERGGGSIISVCSGVIDKPLRRTGSYTVAAAAVAYFTRVFAKEVGPSNVRVNVIAAAPDATASPFPVGPGTESILHDVRAGTPLPQAVTAEELGELSVFLASDSSSSITGQTVRLSGGWTMPW